MKKIQNPTLENYQRIVLFILIVFVKTTCFYLSLSPESFEQYEKWQVSWLPWIYRPSRATHHTMAMEEGKSLSQIDRDGVTVAGTAPVFHRIPFSSREPNEGSGTIILQQT
jgi:hypothetical protein